MILKQEPEIFVTPAYSSREGTYRPKRTNPRILRLLTQLDVRDPNEWSRLYDMYEQRPRKIVLALVIGFFALLLVFYFVFPTPWIIHSDGLRTYRVNRFTGIKEWSSENGWQR